MKKFLMTFLGIAFLLPAVAYADSYCVSFPTSGETKWTKRDNNIGVRFRYDFYRSLVESYYRPLFWVSSGVLKGSGGTNRVLNTKSHLSRVLNIKPHLEMTNNVLAEEGDYQFYPYSTPDLCIYNPIPNFKKVHKSNPLSHVTLPATKVRLDVKWGGDCPTVTLNNERITGDHQFEIYHRKGDLVNPFGCRRK